MNQTSGSMSSAAANAANLSAAEDALADGIPFGSYDYLSRAVSAVYTRLLERVAGQSPGAAALLRALPDGAGREFLLQDPLIRRTAEDAVCTAEGIDAIDAGTRDEILFTAAARAEAGDYSVLEASASCIPLGGQPGHVCVWADDQPQSVPGRRFIEEIRKRLPGFRIAMPNDDQIQQLVAGQALAGDIASRLAHSALSHLRTVVVGDFPDAPTPINALTVPGLPGLVVLSPHALSGVASVAENLVHESLHLKFLDIEYVHPLFPLGFRPYSSPRITPVWHQDNPRQGGWPLDRLLTSMQVYTSLIVFFSLAAARGGDDFYSPDECAARVDRYRSRARWLFTTAQDYLQDLSPAGREFVAWLGTLLPD